MQIREIFDKYDGFIVDLWGVIHDGLELYPNVINTLQHMKSKKIVFLSNAPRRSFKAKQSLDRLGVNEDLYHDIFTSGEKVYKYLKENKIGDNYFVLGPDRDDDIIDGLDYNKVSDIEKADFVIVTGYDKDESKIDEKQPYLEQMIQHDIPMICANPDDIVIRQSGVKAYCAGIIAEQYKKLGGKVKYFGKPYIEVFDEALSYFDSNNIAVIGDNLDTDIKGANNKGLDSYLVTGGILSKDLNVKYGQEPDLNLLKEFLKDKEKPTSSLSGFIW